MAIRTIMYTVTASGVSPITMQFAGMQGEQGVTKLLFKLDNELFTKINTYNSYGEILYRFEAIDSGGGSSFTNYAQLPVQDVEYTIGMETSMFGGNAKIYLVISFKDENEKMCDLYSFPANVYFKAKTGWEFEQYQRQGLSSLAATSKEYALMALSSQAAAQAAQQSAEATAENLATIMVNKVDKVEGKGLSSNDYTNEEKIKLAGLSNYDDTILSKRTTAVEDGKADKSNTYTKSDVDIRLAVKVDAKPGKVLSSNDYTTAEKTKLSGLSNYNDVALANRVTLVESGKSDKATTLLGYGITDSYTKMEADTAISESISVTLGDINAILATIVTGGV